MNSKPGFLARMGMIMNRAMGAMSYRFHVAAANAWRDGYNPLRSLTIARAVSLLEEGERGAFADLQWTYRYIEMQDATLGALIERRTNAIQELDWNIVMRGDVPEEKKAVAAKQDAALKRAYENIGNLTAALEFLAMASFRGYSRLEKVTDDNGAVCELATVDQWFWVRDGLYGQWKYNPAATFGTNRGTDVPEPRFITREVARPINRVALIAFVRKSLSQKDWDGFIEAYGIPAVFVVMPPDLPEDKADEYLDAADQVTGDARGVLPAGSDIKTVDNGARGVNPFKEHLAYQDEQVVLRGTGGKLTMLAESGSGTLGGNAHSETFKAIARGEAKEISEILRKAIDAEIIERVTPGEQAWCGFELAANEEQDTKQVVLDVVALQGGGFRVDPAYVEEKTGYKLTANAEPAEATTILNRASSEGMTWKRFARETGTLEIPRSIMPQIRSENRAAMVNKLRAHGVDYIKAEIKPSDLKPTQAEYSPEKVTRAREHEGATRAILISSDNHVVDGHHQYLAALQDAPNTPIPVFRIKAPIMHVIGIILQMGSTTQEPKRITNRAQAADPFAGLMQAARDAGTGDAQFLALAAEAVSGLREVDPAAADEFWAEMQAEMEKTILANLQTSKK